MCADVRQPRAFVFADPDITLEFAHADAEAQQVVQIRRKPVQEMGMDCSGESRDTDSQ